MNKNQRWPKVRVTEQAHEYAQSMVAELKRQGESASVAALVSQLILAAPFPANNGNGHKPQSNKRQRAPKAKRRTTAPAHKSRG